MEKDISEIKLDSTEDAQSSVNNPKQNSGSWAGNNGRFSWLRSKRLWTIIIGVLLFFGLIIGVPLVKAYSDGKVAYQQALVIKDSIRASDLSKTQDAIKATSAQIERVQSDLKWIGWTKYIPFAGSYVSDASHMIAAAREGLSAGETVVTALEPYADLLGLKGKGTFTGGTTEERMAVVVQTLDKLTPQIDVIATKVKLVRKEIDNVDPNRYPETFQGKAVRSQIAAALEAVDLADNLLTEARPMVSQLPVLLGATSPKKYMVLFQNDKELRPTGGFITAYAIFSVDKGKIHLETSDDIYKLDDTITRHVSPPDPISKYLNVFGWRIRDSNFSPDFPTSMKVFQDLYASSNVKQDISGIIAMDTHVLVRFLDLLAPIKIYDMEFTSKIVPGCNCPMAIYELEKYADQPTYYERGSRKDIIGVMLQTMMQKALSSGKNIYGPLFGGAFDEIGQKHILFYLNNADAQKGINALGFDGAIRSYSGDYLHINDANFGGAKSNLYIVQSVKQDVTVTDSGADVNLSVSYKYPHDADNCSLERVSGLCLAGIYRDYLRIYFPKGAIIKSALGFENKSTSFEDLGHTAIDGFFTVVPQGLANIKVQYQVPGDFKKTGVYKGLIQKQPGTVGNHYTVTVNGKNQQFDLTTDQELSTKL